MIMASELIGLISIICSSNTVGRSIPQISTCVDSTENLLCLPQG